MLILGLAAAFTAPMAGTALAADSYFYNALVPRYGWHTADRYDATGGAITVTLDYPAHGTDVRALACQSRDVIGGKGTFPDGRQTTDVLATAGQVTENRCFELQFASRTLARYRVDGYVSGVKAD